MAWGEPGYPVGLMQLDDAPPLLAAKGDPMVSETAGIAIVGARNASAIAQRFTRDIAGELCRQDFCIVSGLARGIDKAAHDGALQADGKTMAFIGTGIDIAFPPRMPNCMNRLPNVARSSPRCRPARRRWRRIFRAATA